MYNIQYWELPLNTDIWCSCKSCNCNALQFEASQRCTSLKPRWHNVDWPQIATHCNCNFF